MFYQERFIVGQATYTGLRHMDTVQSSSTYLLGCRYPIRGSLMASSGYTTPENTATEVFIAGPHPNFNVNRRSTELGSNYHPVSEDVSRPSFSGARRNQ